jgi:hypothetical protein
MDVTLQIIDFRAHNQAHSIRNKTLLVPEMVIGVGCLGCLGGVRDSRKMLATNQPLTNVYG